MTVTSSGDHVFGRVRPSHDGDFQLNGKTVRVTTFRDLPPPTGAAPYHLDLRDIITASDYEEIVTTKKLVFHFNGDVGGIDFATPQQLVAAGMESDCSVPGQAAPRFLYLAGDCVYFNGEPRATTRSSISHTSIIPCRFSRCPAIMTAKTSRASPRWTASCGTSARRPPGFTSQKPKMPREPR